MNRADVVARLSQFIDKGFVVSLRGGSACNKGDSLLFSGLSLYALDKEEGEPIAKAFEKMLTDLNGGTYRHPDLAEETSLDGLIGMYRGIAKRIRHCDEEKRWLPLLKNHKPSLPREFDVVRSALMGESVNLDTIEDLVSNAANWTDRCRTSNLSAYRVHLYLLALQTLTELGIHAEISAFSKATDGLQMATVDHFCGRQGLLDFVAHFEYNKWQYKHQRCPLWEVPDGLGDEHPAIDYLVAYADGRIDEL